MTLSAGILGVPVFAAEQRNFHIPAGPADRAVRQFVEQAGMSVIYEAGRLNRFKTRALEGKYEPVEALNRLLDGSGLIYSMTTSRFISVNPNRNRGPPGQADESLPTVMIEARDLSSPPSLPPGATLQTISAAELSQQGFTTIPEWARTLTQNQGTGANESTTSYLREAPTNIAYGSGLNLYGIGQRATLVLVNGRRPAPSGSAGSFTDVLNIPVSAVDHIELIADAVAGIVNFVLRDGYSRPLTTASFGHLTPYDLGGNDFSQSLAKAGERWRGVAAVEYYFRSGLPASKRSQATSDLTPWGGTNLDSPFGNPGTIVASNGFRGIPAGQNGTALKATDLLPAANLHDLYEGTWILPQHERLSGLASGSFDLTDHTQIFLDSLLSRRRIKTYVTPSIATLSVPSTNPFYVNPMSGSTDPVRVFYGFGKDLGPVVERGTVNSGQITLGVEHELRSGWHLRASGGYTFDNQLEEEDNLVNFDALTKYLATTDPTTAFNPFGDGSHTNTQTLAAIRADGSLNYRSAFRGGSFEVGGPIPIPLLRAGPMTLTTGYEYRAQTFRSTVSDRYNFTGQALNLDRDRTLNAVYLQTAIPVWARDLMPSTSFNLSLAGGLRYEHFNDFGRAFLPSFGFSFDLSNGISFTGTWARLFRPPNLPDLNESVNYAALYSLADPKSATGYTTALIRVGNNADLSPESAHSWMLGLKFLPSAYPNLSVDAQYFNIVSAHQVLPTEVLPFNLFMDSQYNYLFTRNVTAPALANICSHTTFVGPAGECQSPNIGAIVDLRLRSAETVKTDGFDLKSLYGLDTPIGRFSMNLQATYVLHFGEAVTPGGALINYRNTPHNPTAMRLRGVFGWRNQHFSVSPAFNLQGSYEDNVSTLNRPVGAWATWDLVLGYKLDPLDKVIGGDSTISLRGFNVFNQQPPFLNNAVGAVGYDPENADLLGRRVSLKIEHQW
jgi:outer membrane receptor protein involved in Fe transport